VLLFFNAQLFLCVVKAHQRGVSLIAPLISTWSRRVECDAQQQGGHIEHLT